MYSRKTEQYVSKEFPLLHDICYLDHAGATLYAKSQMNAVHTELNESVFGNPHSLSLSSRHTTDVIDQVRYRILKHFHTTSDDYSVIFTSGTTAALKLLAESFNWMNKNPEVSSKRTENFVSSAQHINEINLENSSDIPPKETCNCEFKAPLLKAQNKETGGTLVYMQDNHTSVLGIREIAIQYGACVHCMSHDFAFTKLERKESAALQIHNESTKTNSLFVYPAQCNFSGVKYPLSWISKVQSGLMSCSNAKCCHHTKWYCCLDAAAFVSTNDLDLSAVKPDFVCISFYKMFGFPTGLGALLVRNSSASTLKRNYFGGGTVQISLSTEMFYVSRSSISDRFEDGTVSFLSIIALRHGFDTLQSLTGGMVNVTLHTLFLARYVHHSLLLMHHGNGNPAVVLYSDTDYEDSLTQGNIVNFNLLRSNGEYIGFAEVLHMANLYGIHLRTGCFCNPGACQRHLNLTVNDLKGHYQAGHVCGDEMDLIEGRPTGSVRVSFGYMSTKHAADQFLDMITSCFIDPPLLMCVPQWWPDFRRTYREKFNMKKLKNGICLSSSNTGADSKTENFNTVVIKEQTFDIGKINELDEDIEINKTKDNSKLSDVDYFSTRVKHHLHISTKKDHDHDVSVKNKGSYHLLNIYLYPVKSCGPMTVSNWEINLRGLKYDREWMVVNASGVALTQKQETKLCLIMPKIDLENQSLILEYEGTSPISIPLEQSCFGLKNDRDASLCESKVCGDHIQGWDCGDDVAEWLCNTLDREGLRLLRQGDIKPRSNKYKSKNIKSDLSRAEISLANQSQFLLLNTASVHWLEEQLTDRNMTTENLIRRFRCNFVVEGIDAFEENNWVKIRIGNVELHVEGPCTRCQMVCIDQETGGRTKEPLRSLSAAFHGKMRFGIYLQHQERGEKNVSVGDPVILTLS